MGPKSLRAVTIAVAFASSTVCSRYPAARAERQAVCQITGWEWKKNSFGDGPCTVASMLEAACRGVDSYPIRPLRGGDDTYYPPQNATSDLTCECDTVTYSLYMACSHCQGGEIYSRTKWAANCGTVYVNQYPREIPNGSAIPRWAFSCTTRLPSQTYNDTVAAAIGRDPEATHQPSDVPHAGHKSETGAIAGGVVGGIAFIILSLVTLFVIKRRRQDGGDQPSHNQETFENFQEKPSFTRGAYYDPDDPTTFPPPMGDTRNRPTHPNSQNPHGQGWGPRPGIPGM